MNRKHLRNVFQLVTAASWGVSGGNPYRRSGEYAMRLSKSSASASQLNSKLFDVRLCCIFWLIRWLYDQYSGRVFDAWRPSVATSGESSGGVRRWERLLSAINRTIIIWYETSGLNSNPACAELSKGWNMSSDIAKSWGFLGSISSEEA
jgi:hypothetical protein